MRAQTCRIDHTRSQAARDAFNTLGEHVCKDWASFGKKAWQRALFGVFVIYFLLFLRTLANMYMFAFEPEAAKTSLSSLFTMMML